MILIFILLGIIQGITEPIPVSSSGHLLLIKNILNINIDYELLSIITNMGSLITIIYIYKNKIKAITKDCFNHNFTLLNKIILSTIPACIIGLIIHKIKLFDKLEANIKFLGITLIITSIFLFLIRKLKGYKTIKKITYKDAIIIGIYQTFALIPGISRSGSTIVGGYAQNISCEDAFDYSFLLYIPISIATSLLGIKKLLTITNCFYYIIAFIFSIIFTYFSTIFFKKIIKKGKLVYFSIYCFILGLIILYQNM